MASVSTLSLFFPVFVPSIAAATAYLGHRALRVDWRTRTRAFLTGPGRTSRILLALFILTNWKSMPLAWTTRIFHAFLYHFIRPRGPLPPRALFHYSITTSRTSPLETDYNFHKSNSTYFTDLDVSRSHLVTHLLGPGMPRLSANARTRLVPDPASPTGEPVRGGFGIGLGAVFCSFRREIAAAQPYDMWSRVLAWDRKWLYIVTHFVVRGKARPTSWDGRSGGRVRPAKAGGSGFGSSGAPEEQEGEDFSKYVIATAVSKYVFKLGRLTVHPAILLHENGLLPERPGAGWRGGDAGVGTADDLGDVRVDGDGEWDWRRIEFERRRGMELAAHFAALDGTNNLFDGGEDGALGHFPLG